jgi:hypothetical protein
MKTNRTKYLLYVLFAIVLLVLCAPLAHAFQTPTPTPTPVSGLPVKIIAVAGVVAAVLQGLKKFIPGLNGWVAVLASVVLAVAGAYATADPNNVLNIQFFTTTVLGALGANGIYSFAQIAGTGTTTTASQDSKASKKS